MANNFFGDLFRITTFGESHGKGIGVVIDGCPAGIVINEEMILEELKKRAPGQTPFTSPRKEPDEPEILSGVFKGQTTGAPLAIFMRNLNIDSGPYQEMQSVLRPSHANFSYLKKYGVFDFRGGGRASGRETVARVAAGAVAKQLLKSFQLEFMTFITSIGLVKVDSVKKEALIKSQIFCPDEEAEKKMILLLQEIISLGDSVGGVVECRVKGIPAGWGEPIYGKLEAKLASAMLSIPATKGFEIGEGFSAACQKGSFHNDPFINERGKTRPKKNSAGGVLAGISTGEELSFKVACKPASSIKIPQESVNLQGEQVEFAVPKTGKHDPCIAIRAVPVVEAMCALVLADLYLLNKSARIYDSSGT